MNLRSGPLNGYWTAIGQVQLSFSDARINGGAITTGWLDVGAAGGALNAAVQISRLIFDDASTAAPSITEELTYPEWGASTSAVPEASTSLGLLALGAGGLLTRRRLKRAA